MVHGRKGKDVALTYTDMAKAIKEANREILVLEGSVKEANRRKLEHFESNQKLIKQNEELSKAAGAATHGFKKQLERVAELNETVQGLTKDYEMQTAQLSELQRFMDAMPAKLKEIGKNNNAVTQTVDTNVGANKELLEAINATKEAYLDGASDVQRFKDSLMEVQREIMEVTHVTKGMNKSMFQAASGSKVWTAASRLLSGTGLWSIQNAIRGVIDVVSIYQTAQQKKIEITQKATKAMENYGDAEAKYLIEAKKVRDHIEGSDYAKLMEESLSYKLMVERGIDKDDALKLLTMEMDAMDLLLDKQKKLILGGKIRQKIRAAIAKQEAKIMPSIKKFFYGDPDDKTGKSGLFGKKATMGTSEVKWKDDDEEVKAGRRLAGTTRIAAEPAQKSGMQMFMDNWTKDNTKWDKKRDESSKVKTFFGGPVKTMREDKSRRERMMDAIGGKFEIGGKSITERFGLKKSQGMFGAGDDTKGGKMGLTGMAREQLAKRQETPWFSKSKEMFGGMSKRFKDKNAEGGLFSRTKGMASAVGGGKIKDFWTKHGEKAKTALSVITGIPLIWKLWKARGTISAALSGKMLKIMPAISFVFGKMKIALMYFLMGMILVFIVVKVIQMAWKAMSKFTKSLEGGFFEAMAIGERFWSFISTLFDWFGSLWKIVYSAFTGDFDGLIDGIFEFGLNTLLLGVDLLMLGLSLLATLAVGIFLGFVNWIAEAPVKNIGKLLKGIGIVLAVWGAWLLVKWLVAAVTSYIVGIWGFIPTAITLGILALAVLFTAKKDEIVAFVTGLWEDIKNLPSKIGEFIKGDGIPYLPFVADGGTVTSAGLAVVGEKGPEIVRLPQGARVHSNSDSRKISGMSGSTNNITVNVNGRLGASDKELRDLANKVGRMINKEINRTTSASGRLG